MSSDVTAVQQVFSLQTDKSELKSYEESKSYNESMVGLVLELGYPNSRAVSTELPFIPDLCTGEKKHGMEWAL